MITLYDVRNDAKVRTVQLGFTISASLQHIIDLVRKVYAVCATSVLDSSVFSVYKLTVSCSFIFCCCCFLFCCRRLFLSLKREIRQEGSFPSYAAGRSLGGFLHHYVSCHEIMI